MFLSTRFKIIIYFWFRGILTFQLIFDIRIQGFGLFINFLVWFFDSKLDCKFWRGRGYNLCFFINLSKLGRCLHSGGWNSQLMANTFQRVISDVPIISITIFFFFFFFIFFIFYIFYFFFFILLLIFHFYLSFFTNYYWNITCIIFMYKSASYGLIPFYKLNTHN